MNTHGFSGKATDAVAGVPPFSSFFLAHYTLFFSLVLFAAPALAASGEAASARVKLGDLGVWILSVNWLDQSAEILLPQKSEEQEAVATAYPKGNIRNSLNVMLVRGESYTALVDTGLAATQSALVRRLQEAGVSPEEVTHIIITHGHSDHIGGLSQEGKALFPRAEVLVSRPEYDFLFASGATAASDDDSRQVAAEVFTPYKERITIVDVDERHDILPGLRLIPAYGHTPGHMTVLLSSGGKSLLFWGDLLHAMKVQVEHPDICATYDMDARAARAARKAMLERIRKEHWLAIGTHLPAVQPFSLE